MATTVECMDTRTKNEKKTHQPPKTITTDTYQLHAVTEMTITSNESRIATLDNKVMTMTTTMEKNNDGNARRIEEFTD